MSLSFTLIAMLTLAGAAAGMAFRGLVHCVLALVVAFAGLGAMYLALGAQFIGLAQLLIYVGAIAVLIVFAILLTRGDQPESPLSMQPSSLTAGILAALAVFAILAWGVGHSSVIHLPASPAPQATIRQIGAALMDLYILPLELMGLLLTAALLGAVILAMKEKPGAE